MPATLPLPPELAETVDACMRTIAPAVAETLGKNPRSTITPAHHTPDAEMARAMELLRVLGAELGSARALDIEGTLGEGGMGVVRLATQRTVGRKVALKTLRDGVSSPAAHAKLLYEGWTTGALEHPNVVPVYDIGTQLDGTPFIVLKRIEGQHWGELMRDAETVAERFGVDDLLEWNLRTLMQVCNAVHFAHSRGIVHRDLKPENVMLGRFGEVYLVDWGIAVALRDEAGGRVPLADHAPRLAGTPCYMAPEMLAEDLGSLSERTDVYLLGSLLYEILAGHPPHGGKDLVAIFSSVVLSEPSFPDGAPKELVRICSRAMARDASERYESAEALRLALQDFLSHTGSVRLAAGAEDSLQRLRQALSAAGQPPDRAQLYDLLGECRFGFRSALQAWPDNEEARRGLGEAIVQMAEFELGRGDPHAAELLVAELKPAPAGLISRIARARSERDAAELRNEELRRVGASLDPTVGQRTRLFLGGILGAVWTLSPALAHLLTGAGHALTSRRSITFDLIVSALVIALVIWARDSMMRSALNRRVALTLLAAMALKTSVDVWVLMTHRPPIQGLVLASLLFCAVATLSAIHLGWKLLPVAIAYLALFFVAGLDPSRVMAGLSVANGVLTLCIFWIWLPNRKLGKGFWGDASAAEDNPAPPTQRA